MIYVFLIMLLLLFYHIIGYPLILFILTLGNKEEKLQDCFSLPSITVLCPAYNEVAVIEEKIKSFLGLSYPKDKIDLIIISDDSDDGTNEIVEEYMKKFSNIKLVIQKPRRGKPSGHNLVTPHIKSEYILSTDANSLFKEDAVNQLLKVMLSEKRIGIVSGTLKLINNKGESGEGLYWRYESAIKAMESKLYTILGSNGSIFLIKRELFLDIHPASVDDFERTLQVLKSKRLGKYAEKAIVFEDNSELPIEELKRKVRIISREWFALKRNFQLLLPWKFPAVSWMLFSHKVLRWIFFLPCILIFISNLFIINNNTFFFFTFILQLLNYVIGLIEFNLEKKGKGIKVFKLPGYYFMMFYASLLAFIKFLRGSQQATWSTIREEKK